MVRPFIQRNEKWAVRTRHKKGAVHKVVPFHVNILPPKPRSFRAERIAAWRTESKAALMPKKMAVGVFPELSDYSIEDTRAMMLPIADLF